MTLLIDNIVWNAHRFWLSSKWWHHISEYGFDSLKQAVHVLILTRNWQLLQCNHLCEKWFSVTLYMTCDEIAMSNFFTFTKALLTQSKDLIASSTKRFRSFYSSLQDDNFQDASESTSSSPQYSSTAYAATHNNSRIQPADSTLSPGAESPPRNVSGYNPTGPNSHVGGSALSLPRANRGIFGLSTYTPRTPSPPRRKYSDEVEKWVSNATSLW